MMKVVKTVETLLEIEVLEQLQVSYSNKEILPVIIKQALKENGVWDFNLIKMKVHQLDLLIEALTTLRDTINEE